MAGIITHAYFSLDLYNKLSIRSKELLIDEKESLKTFSLSNNILLFYKGNKKINRFNSYFEENKVYEFFSTLINYIKYNEHQYNPQVISYLYGMISHYVLASTINPYIIYKTGTFNINNPNTYKYNMLGYELESYFDNYMISIRENMNPYLFKGYKACFNLNHLNKDLKEVMDFTYKEVFGIDNFHTYYLKSVERMREFYRIYRYDPKGYKKCFYKIYDSVFSKRKLRKEPISYHIKSKKKFLNLEHNTWYNPTDKRTKSNESYLELYTKALNKAANIIHDINNYFYYDKKINLKKVIGNLSYNTGKDCSKERELKYFEF